MHKGGHVKLGERVTRRSRRLDSEALVKDDQQVMGSSPSSILPDLDILGHSSSSSQTHHSSGNANVKYLGDNKKQEREDVNNSSEDRIIKVVGVDKELSRAAINVHHLQGNPEIKKPLHHTLVFSELMNIYSSNIFYIRPPRDMDEEISSVDFMDNTGGLTKDSYSPKFNNSSQSPLKIQQRGNLLKKSVKKTAGGPLIVTRMTTKGKENALNQNLMVKSKSNIKGTNGQVREHHDDSGSMGQSKLEILVDNKLSGTSASDENIPQVSLTGDQHSTSNFHIDECAHLKFPVIAPTLSEFTHEPLFTIPNFGIVDAPLSFMDEHNQSNLGLTEFSRQNMDSKTVNSGDGVTDVSYVKYNNLLEQVKGNKLPEVSVHNVSLSDKRNNKMPHMRGNAVKRKMNEEVKVQTRSDWKTSCQDISCSNTTQDANITLDTSCSPESNINALEIHALKVYDVLPWQKCFDNMEVGTVIPASVHNPYTLTFQGTFDAGFFLREAKGLSLLVFKEDCPSSKDKTPIALFIQMSNKDLFKIKGQKKSVNLFIGTKQLGSKTVENSNQNVSTRMFTLGSPASCSTPRHDLGESGLLTPPYSSNAAHKTSNSTSNVFNDAQVCTKPDVSSKHSSCDNITPQKLVYLLNDTRLASARMAWHEYQATIADSYPEALDPEFQPLVIMKRITQKDLEQSLNQDYDKNFDADFDDDDTKHYERKEVQQTAGTDHSQQEDRSSISTNRTNTKLFPQILCHGQTNVSDNIRNLINRKEVEEELKLFLSGEKQFCEKNFDKNTKANRKRQSASGKDNAVRKTKLCSFQPFPKKRSRKTGRSNKCSKGESKSAAATVLKKKGYSIRLWQNYDKTAFWRIQQECNAASRSKKASKNVRKTPSRLQCKDDDDPTLEKLYCCQACDVTVGSDKALLTHTASRKHVIVSRAHKESVFLYSNILGTSMPVDESGMTSLELVEILEEILEMDMQTVVRRLPHNLTPSTRRQRSLELTYTRLLSWLRLKRYLSCTGKRKMYHFDKL